RGFSSCLGAILRVLSGTGIAGEVSFDGCSAGVLSTSGLVLLSSMISGPTLSAWLGNGIAGEVSDDGDSGATLVLNSKPSISIVSRIEGSDGEAAVCSSGGRGTYSNPTGINPNLSRSLVSNVVSLPYEMR